MDATQGLPDASLYTDLGGLQALRGKAGSQQPAQSAEAEKEVAKQFEALFLQMMLKSMRDATDTISDKENSMESDQTRFYQEMFDKQIALNLASNENGHGLGIAAMLERNMIANQQQTPEIPAVSDELELIRSQVNRSGALLQTGNDAGQEE